MSEEEQTQLERTMDARGRASRSWFDPKVNIGHIMAIAGIGLGFWVTCKLTLSDHESRLKAIEEDRKELRSTMAEANRNTTDVLRSITEIKTQLKYIPGNRSNE